MVQEDNKEGNKEKEGRRGRKETQREEKEEKEEGGERKKEEIEEGDQEDNKQDKAKVRMGMDKRTPPPSPPFSLFQRRREERSKTLHALSFRTKGRGAGGLMKRARRKYVADVAKQREARKQGMRP